MEDSAFREMVESYKKELMDMARRTGVLGRQSQTSAAAAEADAAQPASVYPAGSDTSQRSGGNSQNNTQPAPSLELPARELQPEEGEARSEGELQGTGPIINPPETEELALLEGAQEPTETYAAFQQRTPGRGSIKIQASMADGAYPVPGMTVVISKDFTDGTHVFHTAVTDADGIIDDDQVAARIITLRNKPVLPEDLKGDDIDEIMNFTPEYLSRYEEQIKNNQKALSEKEAVIESLRQYRTEKGAKYCRV